MFRHFLKKADLLSALAGGTIGGAGTVAALNKAASIQDAAQDVLFEKAAAAVQALDEYEAAFDLYKYASAVEGGEESGSGVGNVLAGLTGAGVGSSLGAAAGVASVPMLVDNYTKKQLGALGRAVKKVQQAGNGEVPSHIVRGIDKLTRKPGLATKALAALGVGTTLGGVGGYMGGSRLYDALT